LQRLSYRDGRLTLEKYLKLRSAPRSIQWS